MATTKRVRRTRRSAAAAPEPAPAAAAQPEPPPATDVVAAASPPTVSEDSVSAVDGPEMTSPPLAVSEPAVDPPISDAAAAATDGLVAPAALETAGEPEAAPDPVATPRPPRRARTRPPTADRLAVAAQPPSVDEPVPPAVVSDDESGLTSDPAASPAPTALAAAPDTPALPAVADTETVPRLILTPPLPTEHSEGVPFAWRPARRPFGARLWEGLRDRPDLPIVIIAALLLVGWSLSTLSPLGQEGALVGSALIVGLALALAAGMLTGIIPDRWWETGASFLPALLLRHRVREAARQKAERHHRRLSQFVRPWLEERPARRDG